MAETHEQVVKVWIAPGCIVCDSCETDCPEVFDVQEETCLIRPEAESAEFTKPLTPSIIDAAEGCPVDVIKFETVEVEGPAPWAGQEEEAAPTASGDGGGAAVAAKPKEEIPVGPPDPKWAGLLEAAHTTASRSAGGAATATRPAAKATADAIGHAMPHDAPPDAMAAAMIGTGFAKPKPSVKENIKRRGQKMSRRAATATIGGIGMVAGLAWAAMAATAATWGGAFQAFLVPKVTKEPPSSFRAGKLTDYGEDGVYEQFKPNNVWIVREKDTIYALSTICTHLGCIPNWLAIDQKFKCPCHGSGFYKSGVNFEGPAPRPLERLAITVEDGNVFIDKSKVFRQELGQWGQPGSEITV